MNSDPLSEIWNSAANCHDATEGERVAAEFVTRLRRRRRFQAWWLGWTFLALSAITVLALMQFAGDRAGASEQASQWALAPLLALPWLVAVHFLRAFFRENTAPANVAPPLRVILDAARASNTHERRRLVIVLALLAATAPFVAFAIRQLQLAGKVAAHEAWSMALVLGVALALGAVLAAVRLRYRLLPERRRIESLLRDVENSAAS